MRKINWLNAAHTKMYFLLRMTSIPIIFMHRILPWQQPKKTRKRGETSFSTHILAATSSWWTPCFFSMCEIASIWRKTWNMIWKKCFYFTQVNINSSFRTCAFWMHATIGARAFRSRSENVNTIRHDSGAADRKLLGVSAMHSASAQHGMNYYYRYRIAHKFIEKQFK